MKLNTIAANQNEIVKDNGNVVFFSYNTPVAALIGGKFYRTDKKWSNTTSRHINNWLDGVAAEVKPQSYFDGLM
jgi:hypothetical protein